MIFFKVSIQNLLEHPVQLWLPYGYREGQGLFCGQPEDQYCIGIPRLVVGPIPLWRKELPSEVFLP